MTIDEFPLSWRWMQSAHAILPADVLARILPLSQSDAGRVHQRGKEPQDKVPVRFPAGDGAKNWLRTVQSDLAARIFVSWSKEWAVEMTWEIFTEYWDDFCYPSSDDVTVLPVSGDWRLRYHNDEQFDFVG